MAHVGKIIHDYVERNQINISDLAEQLPTERSNVYKHFAKEHLSTDIIFKYNKALNYNFFNDLADPDQSNETLSQCQAELSRVNKLLDLMVNTNSFLVKKLNGK